MPVKNEQKKIKCPGCGRKLKELDVFHVAECTSKQLRMEDVLK